MRFLGRNKGDREGKVTENASRVMGSVIWAPIEVIEREGVSGAEPR